MPASDVIGTEVQNAEGETVAEIVDLVKEQGAEDLYAVLSVGGFLGIGDKKVVVPLEELDVDQEGEIVMANVTRGPAQRHARSTTRKLREHGRT